MKIQATVLAVAIALSMPISALAENKKFTELSQDFMYESLARRPNLASCAGYHRHVHKKSRIIIELDGELDNFSAEQMQDQVKFYTDWREKFKREIDLKTLDKEELADWKLIDNQISQNLLEYQSIKSYAKDPAQLPMIISTAVIQPLRAPDFTLDQKQRYVILRLKEVGRAVKQAKDVLHVSSPYMIESGLGATENVLGVIEKTLPNYFPAGTVNQPAFASAARVAADELRGYGDWLKAQRDSLPVGDIDDDWRLGKDLYDKKFALFFDSGTTPDQVLLDCESQFKKVRALMLTLAEPMYAKMFSAPLNKPDESEEDRQNRIIGAVLEQVSTEHPERNQVMDTIKADLDEVKKFVAKSKLVSLNKRMNLRVVPASDFYSWHTFAGLNSAPPLEPQVAADFWVMPISASMPDDKAESLLREYNNYTLKWLVIHEALPGHYIQSERLNALQPVHRRLLRATFRNEAYVEGWAEYIAQEMMNAGFMQDEPKYKLCMHKIRLRLITNTMLDIKMHTTKMTDQEAIELLMKGAFQNLAEAQNKLKRVKLSSCHLPSYYVGMREWQNLRAKQEKLKGKDFDAMQFHNKALDQGPLPVSMLEELLN